jgi:agmatine deiminase
MPAEWEPHDATWIAWPHHEPDWPGKLVAVQWAYAEIVRLLSAHERVEILCADAAASASAGQFLDAHEVPRHKYRLHNVPTDRVWLRDSAPTFVLQEGRTVELVNWRFNGWAKYDNFARDSLVGSAIARIAGLPLTPALRENGTPLVLEGGAIDCDGRGTLLATEECLLSTVQERNPGLDRAGYERAFQEYLGITRTIWLGNGCAGDDTHGHVDDIARFLTPGVVALAFEADHGDANHASSVENLTRLRDARDASGAPLRIVKIPYPRPVMMMGVRLPASYLNFYITNGSLLVPTFNDPNDRKALRLLADFFPGRRVVGVHAVDLVWGLGTLHCLTQQQIQHGPHSGPNTAEETESGG